MKKITIDLVKGSSGYSLQLKDKEGNGERYAGPKAWGNPYNKPTASFKVDVDDFIKALERNAYEVEESDK